MSYPCPTIILLDMKFSVAAAAESGHGVAKIIETCTKVMVTNPTEILIVVCWAGIVFPVVSLYSCNTMAIPTVMPREKTVITVCIMFVRAHHNVGVICMMRRRKMTAITARRIVVRSSQAIVATVGTLVWVPWGLPTVATQ